MNKFNLIVVFDQNVKNILVCKRKKDPFINMFNFVGGKLNQDEDSLEAAYRELHEETKIDKSNISLKHLMDLNLYYENTALEVYFGTLKQPVEVQGEENDLFWQSLDSNHFDSDLYAGDGDFSLILKHAKNALKI